ncbi:GNAT family N-acetyltransferase [Nocardioides sp.]|uniref:GNAT family N-acetyltransferase n=1 Tax=Nocardioides sp. TaxID=35761 RepID=UPI0035B2FCC0
MTYLATTRLDVRRFAADDVAAFTAYRADPDVARYQSWDTFTHAHGTALVEAMQERELGAPGEWFQLALEDRDRRVLVGDVACKVNADETREMEIGFTLARAEQGRGYATEALNALLDHGFGPMHLHRFTAITDARNTAAAALLNRVGMRQEAHFVDNVFFKGEWGSELLFAKLAREHRPAPRLPTTTDPASYPYPSHPPGGIR